MKWFLIIVGLLFVVGLVAYISMAIQSKKKPDGLGLEQGLLRLCPDSPNCVCSESHSQSSEQHAIRPFKVSEISWNQLKELLIEQGGVIEQNDKLYMHATFTTPVFRYVDDVELRLDERLGLIHIRSASRVGRSDFGVNRKRVSQLLQWVAK